MTNPTITNNVAVRPAKTQISLGIRPVWSEPSLSAWRNLRSLATNWAHSEDTDQTGRIPRLTWVFAGCTHTLLILSCRGSYLWTFSTYLWLHQYIPYLFFVVLILEKLEGVEDYKWKENGWIRFNSMKQSHWHLYIITNNWLRTDHLSCPILYVARSN